MNDLKIIIVHFLGFAIVHILHVVIMLLKMLLDNKNNVLLVVLILHYIHVSTERH